MIFVLNQNYYKFFQVIRLEIQPYLASEGEENTATPLNYHVENGIRRGLYCHLHGQTDLGVRLVAARTTEHEVILVLEHREGVFM